MNTIYKGIAMLIRSGITGEKLTLPEGFSLEDAAELIRKHSIIPLVYPGAVNCGIPKDHPLMQKMLMFCYRNLMKHELQMADVKRILEAFEQNGIPHMPVKGCVIKHLYPKPDMRPMGDADILIHPEDHPRIAPVMESLGFTFRCENDHVFEWESSNLHVELHKLLVPITDRDYCAYYGTGWQLAKKKEGVRHDLSREDAYLFAFTHFARHYRGGGIGCRHVTDLFVYHRAYPDLDIAYIRQELKKLHLEEFHENVMRMLDVWFADRETDPVVELLTCFIMASGNWGTMESEMLAEQIKAAGASGSVKNTGLRSVIRWFFPPVSQLSYRYSLIRKSVIFLPVVWVIRWMDILFFRPQKIRGRIRTMQVINDERVKERRQAMRAVGLDYDLG